MDRIKDLFSIANGENPVEIARGNHLRYGNTASLRELVVVLEKSRRWDEMEEYSNLLLQETLSIEDAERYILALNNNFKTSKIIQFCNAQSEYLNQSVLIRLCYAWALHLTGNFVDCDTYLNQHTFEVNNKNYKRLQINQAILGCDWQRLDRFVSEVYTQRETASAEELLDAAILANQIDSGLTRALLYAATEKGSSNPNLLLNAYFLATSSGIENSEKVHSWLAQAISSSSEDGPIKHVDLETLIEQKPDWDSRVSETWAKFSSAEIPISIAAKLLRKSTLELSLSQALANLNEPQFWKKSLIPTFAGNRQTQTIDLDKSKIGVDYSALITLAILGVLDKLPLVFDEIHICHTLPFLLFNEQSKIKFHQPSRIKDAKEIIHLVSSGVISKLDTEMSINDELVQLIGQDISSLITEAITQNALGKNCYIVRPYPVHVISSFMKEEADLKSYYNVFSSCSAIVKAIEEKGLITSAASARYLDYLTLQEKEWPEQPSIKDNSTLLLDDLAVTYFQHLGLLKNLSDAGFDVKLHSSVIDELNALIVYEGISEQALQVVEKIREFLTSGIKSKKIIISSINEDTKKYRSDHISDDSLLGLLSLGGYCDAVVADDRFINKFNTIGYNSNNIPVFDSLDILSLFHKEKLISEYELSEYLTKLRKAGYYFVRFTSDELSEYLIKSKVADNKVLESAELRVIHENIVRLRATNWLQLPAEALWLDQLAGQLLNALIKIWGQLQTSEESKCKADWIVNLINTNNWAHRLVVEDSNRYSILRGPEIISLIKTGYLIKESNRKSYFEWLNDSHLNHLSESEPVLFEWIVSEYGGYLDNLVQTCLEQERVSSDEIESLVIELATQFTPRSILSALLNKSNFQKKYNLPVSSSIYINKLIKFDRLKFIAAVGHAINDPDSFQEKDSQGAMWQFLRKSSFNIDGEVQVVADQQKFSFDGFAVLSEEKRLRLEDLDRRIAKYNLLSSDIDYWKSIFINHAPSEDELYRYQSAYQNTPIFFRDTLIQLFDTNAEISISNLLPDSRRYFENLIGKYDGSFTILDYSNNTLKTHIKQLLEWNSDIGCMLALNLSSHISISELIDIGVLNEADLIKLYDDLESSSDALSITAAIEIGMKLINDHTLLEEKVLNLIKIFINEMHNEFSRVSQLTLLFQVIDNEISKRGTLVNAPPFYRRLASLTHASLISKITQELKITKDFNSWIADLNKDQFVFQSLCDLRLEPRWMPGMIDTQTFYQDLLGRILNAGWKYLNNLTQSRLHKVIFDDEDCLLNQVKILQPFWPSVIEGGTLVLKNEELLKSVSDNFKSDKPDTDFYKSIMNFSVMFEVGTTLIDRIIHSLKSCKYQLKFRDEADVIETVKGLAYICATNRNKHLANSVMMLCKVNNHNGVYKMQLIDQIETCLIAAACSQDIKEWSSYIGDWFDYLSWEDLNEEELSVFSNTLEQLIRIEPSLLGSCGKCVALLEGKLKSN